MGKTGPLCQGLERFAGAAAIAGIRTARFSAFSGLAKVPA